MLDELRGSRGRIALVVGDAASDVARRIAEAWGTEVMCVGRVLTSGDRPPTREEVLRAFDTGEVFDEIEILFSPELALDPIDALRSMARMRPRLCVWPGTIAGRRAAFSLPGRGDRCDEQLADVVVLRARDTVFPDETPFEVERIP